MPSVVSKIQEWTWGFWLLTSIAHFLEVPEIYIPEDTALGTVIYRAAAKDPEEAVLEVIHGLGPRISGVLCVATFTKKPQR